MTNNGAEHALRQVGRHLRNMLNQPDGNFAHQLMEQMNPFEFLVRRLGLRTGLGRGVGLRSSFLFSPDPYP